MTGVIPDSNAGGVIVRNAAGVCLPVSGVTNAFCPPATFRSTCDIAYLPDDCTGQITAAQINAIVSEIICFASTLSPSGIWNCLLPCNLSSAFGIWSASNKIVDNVTITGAGVTGNPWRVSPENTVSAICQNNTAHDALAACLISTDALNTIRLGTDGGLLSVYQTPEAIATGICATVLAKNTLAACLISQSPGNGIRAGTDGGLFTPAQTPEAIATGICSVTAAKNTLAACLISTDALNTIRLGTDGGLLSVYQTPEAIATGICGTAVAREALVACLIDASPANGIRRGTSGGLFTPALTPESIATGICATAAAKNTLAACLISPAAGNTIRAAADGGLFAASTADIPADGTTISGNDNRLSLLPQGAVTRICNDGPARRALASCLVASPDVVPNNILSVIGEGLVAEVTGSSVATAICNSPTGNRQLIDCLISDAPGNALVRNTTPGIEGMFVAAQSAGGGSGTNIYECLPQDLPIVAEACSIEQVVVFTDAAGCRRFGKYSEAVASISDANPSSVYPPGTLQFSSPGTSSSEFYNHEQAMRDTEAGTVDPARLANTMLARISVTLACTTKLSHTISWNTILAPGPSATGTVVIRTNGRFTRVPGGSAEQLGQITNFMRVVESTFEKTYAPGQYVFEYFAMTYDAAYPPARYINGIPQAGTITIRRSLA